MVGDEPWVIVEENWTCRVGNGLVTRYVSSLLLDKSLVDVVDVKY